MKQVINIDGKEHVLLIYDEHAAYGLVTYLVPMEMAKKLYIDEREEIDFDQIYELRDYMVPHVYTNSKN